MIWQSRAHLEIRQPGLGLSRGEDLDASQDGHDYPIIQPGTEPLLPSQGVGQVDLRGPIGRVGPRQQANNQR